MPRCKTPHLAHPASKRCRGRAVEGRAIRAGCPAARRQRSNRIPIPGSTTAEKQPHSRMIMRCDERHSSCDPANEPMPAAPPPAAPPPVAPPIGDLDTKEPQLPNLIRRSSPNLASRSIWRKCDALAAPIRTQDLATEPSRRETMADLLRPPHYSLSRS